MRVDQKDNFYHFPCDEIADHYQGRHVPGIASYTACQMMIRRIKEGTDHGMWPECARAVEAKRCPAMKMLGEEFKQGSIYYVDRDDCGPGVIKRVQQGREPRSADEVEKHHQMLAALDLEPWKPPASKSVRSTRSSSPQSEVSSQKPNQPAPKLGLGEMISAEAEAHTQETT